MGRGGGHSKYAEWHGNTGGGGEQLIPMSETEAKKWAEKHLDEEDYEEAFGPAEEA